MLYFSRQRISLAKDIAPAGLILLLDRSSLCSLLQKCSPWAIAVASSRQTLLYDSTRYSMFIFVRSCDPLPIYKTPFVTNH